MLTIFTVPKPFVGHTGIIQKNAIRSWQQAAPGCQILLFGDEEGVAQAAAELGVQNIARVQRSSLGAPLLNGIFKQAIELSQGESLCFVNADIIFTGSFHALATLSAPFLVVGESMDLKVPDPIDFSNPGWRDSLGEGVTRGPFALDYFIFTKELYRSMPPFRVGRARYDNWMVWHALRSGAMVINAAEVLKPIHQNHDYGHLTGGRREAYRGSDARINQKLAGLGCYLYLHSVDDARWVLTPGGLNRSANSFRFLRQFFGRLKGLLRERGWFVQAAALVRPSELQSKSGSFDEI